MSAPAPTRIRLSDPAQLIAAVPHLLGFVPRNSLILITMQGKQLGLTLRADLVVPADAEALAGQLLGPILRQQPTAVMLLVIGGEPDTVTGQLPHRGLVNTLDAALAAEGVPVVHAAWAAGTAGGRPWCCYEEQDCRGVVPDSAGSAVAAACVAAGTVTFDSRDQLAELLTPDPPAVLAERGRLLERADAEHPMPRAVAAARYAQLAALREAAGGGQLSLDDRALSQAVSGLCDYRVRDACLAWSADEKSAAAEQLWLALTRATPGRQRAEPATLLAVSAYLRGDGALASIALDAALEARSDHGLAGLVRRALTGALAPGMMRDVAADAGADAWLGLHPGGERDE